MFDENQQNLIEVKTSLDTALGLINNLKGEISSNTQRLDELSSKILSLYEKFLALDDIFQRKNETIHSLEQIEASNQQLDQAKIALDDLTRVVGDLQDSFNKQKIEQEESIKSINSTIDTLKFKIGETITKFIKFNEIEKSIDEQRSAIEELDSSFSQNEAEFNKIKSNFEEVTSNVDSLKKNYEEIRDKIVKLEGEHVDIEGLAKRINNIEKEIGITTGDLIGRSYDSVGMLRQTVSQLVGEEKVDQFVPEGSIEEPVLVIKILKSLIRELSFMDDSNIPSTSEILLKYSEISDKTDRISLFLAFNNDIRRLMEVGQAVLMEIGQKRTQTRRLLEEVRNLASKWTGEDDLTGDSGILAALELLKILEMEFQSA